MSTGNDAHLGYWEDHNRRFLDKRQVLATDFWSTVMKSVVAVGLTLVAPYVYKIGKSFLIWLFDRDGGHVAVRNVKNASPETIPLLNDHTHNAPVSGLDDAPSHHQNQADASSVLQNGNSRDLESQDASHARGSECRIENADDFLSQSGNSDKAVWIVWDRSLAVKAIVVIIVVFFGLFVAQAIAGVFSAKIASDRAGLTSSPHCGIWQFDDDAGDEAADRDDLGNYQKEARASQYARTCYNSPDPDSPFACRTFYNQSIKFDTFTHQPCPFPSSLLCADGLYSAVTFDTGLVDASIIGINAVVTHKFRRTTTCSPLNMSEPYVISDDDDADDTAYRYYYGPKDDDGYTFNTSGRPFEWHVPVYSVNTYFSSLYPDSDYWRPLSELKPPMNNTLTIMFVSSMHIYHEKPSFDPIFTANQPKYFEDLREPFYYNSDPRAKVLACIDRSEVCSPDGRTCWSMNSPVPDQVSSPSAYWFMKWSLENSNIYNSIKWRLGTALLAQESVSQWVSIPLPPDQWQLEASQLFATSLARVQYDAWSIATGEDRQQPGYVDKTPDEAKGQLCGLYKFKTLDFTNINLAAFIGLAVLAIFIFILGLDARTAWFMPKSKKEKIKVKDEKMSNPTLIIDLCVNGLKRLCHTCYCFVCRFVNGLKWRCYTCYCSVCKAVREAWEKLRQWYRSRESRHTVDLDDREPRA